MPGLGNPTGNGSGLRRLGGRLFRLNCAGCHGDRGIGMPDVGGPDLTDKIWLYDGSLQAITAQKPARKAIAPTVRIS